MTSHPGRRYISIWSLRLCAIALVVFLGVQAGSAEPAVRPDSVVAFVVTSDVHYGILRGKFRGQAAVESRVVNAALVQAINHLPETPLPGDRGLRAGQTVGAIDFVAITGDIANRQEAVPIQIQSAAVSWHQFTHDFVNGLTIINSAGQRAQLLPVPGNHDATNAIGHFNRLNPATDASALAGIYNLTMRPAAPRTKDTYDYVRDNIHYSLDFPGLHVVFLTVWPDSRARAWMETALKAVPSTTPVIIFCHDPPAVGASHLTNPNGRHDLNKRDKFENLLSDQLAGGTTTEASTAIEQRALVAFLKAHPNIVAYFHGHNNWSEFYTWRGPDEDIALPTFRVDSPMKGKYSGPDEAKLSFQLAVYDPATQRMTVRECRWNSPAIAKGGAPSIGWGESVTVSLAPRRQP
ncbi:MAG: metallophosphoesterase [Opitutus sp.]|nr:metallophosphoesterase [Opitutus sp.]